MPTIDFSEVKDLVPIPNGPYDAEISFAQEGVSKAGNQKIELRWKVLGGEFANRLVFDNLTFTPNALFRVKQCLAALGWDVKAKGSQEIGAADLVGLQATIVVGLDKQEGTDESGEEYAPRNKVIKYKPVGSAVDVASLVD